MEPYKRSRRADGGWRVEAPGLTGGEASRRVGEAMWSPDYPELVPG